MGVGGGVETDLLGEAPTEGTLSAFAEGTAKVPFVSGKVGGEFDLICGTGKGNLGGSVGPFSVGGASEGGTSGGGGADPSSETWQDALAGAPSAKLEGKAGFKGCLPPPPG